VNRLRVWLVVESGTDVRLVENLAERAEVTVLARRIRGGVEISQPLERAAPAVPVTVGPASRAAFAAMVFAHLLRARRREDRVLVQDYGAAALAANAAARITGTPTFMLVCSPLELYYRCRISHPLPGQRFHATKLAGLTRLARLNARWGRHYIALSQHLEDVVRSHGATRPVSVVPIYGVDTAMFRPPDRPRDILRRQRGLPEQGEIILFSSRIAPEKDAETLLAAFKRLRDAGRDAWLLNRSGGYRTLQAYAERARVADRVIATDAVHPLRELPLDYQACDLCVQASRAEGLGFSALEALACETPVVATAVGGLRETILDGETGWTYPAGDASALARSMTQALTRREEARRRAQAGRRMVQERFERGPVFDRLMAVLEAG
jgi:glycosyltransferase involved in cell wall biosynthesis